MLQGWSLPLKSELNIDAMKKEEVDAHVRYEKYTLQIEQ